MESSFAERLKQLRISSGYKTQLDFARACGISPTEISRLEKVSPDGEIRANSETILKICTLTNVDLNWLLKGEDFPIVVKPAKHPTEIRCPEQCQMFRKCLNEIYSLHLKKNEDYSPRNINMTGQIGIITRLWDKTSRLLNLEGYDLVRKKQSFFIKWWFRLTNQSRLFYLRSRSVFQPNFESIDDTEMDLATYALIKKIHRSGKWGH